MSDPVPSERILQGVVDSISDSGVLLDSRGRVLDVLQNDRTADLFGRPPNEFVGDTLRDVLPAPHADQFHATIHDALESGDPRTLDRPMDVDRGERRLGGRVVPVGDNEPEHVLWLVEDASQRTQQPREGKLLDRIFDVSPIGLVVVDPSGDISRANERAERILGLERDEITERTYDQAEWNVTYDDGTPIPDDDHPVARVLETGESVLGFEHWIELPDGTKRWLSSHAAPILDGDGNVERVVVGIDDITRLKARKEQLEWLIKNEELANLGGWELDLETGTIQGMAGMNRLHGDDEYHMPVDDVVDLYHPDDCEQVRDAITTCREDGVPFELEVRRRTADGYDRWVRVKGERVEDQGQPKIRGISRDITAVKEREQRLQVMTRALRHNLKNKLNVIGGHAALLRDELDSLEVPVTLDDGGRDILDSIRDATVETENLHSEIRLLQGLMADFSRLSVADAKASANKINAVTEDLVALAETVRDFDNAINLDGPARTVELGPLLTALTTDYSARYPGAEIDVDVADVSVTGDPEALRLILEVPLENALKHSDQVEPTVSVALFESTAGQVTVRIEDGGPGLPETERALLNGADETQTSHSSGLGLWTMQWLTRRLGGTVSVTDNDSDGTVVELTFPAPTDDRVPSVNGRCASGPADPVRPRCLRVPTGANARPSSPAVRRPSRRPIGAGVPGERLT